jgi:hypothetical protein
MKCHQKKIKIIEDINDDESVLSSCGVVLEVNKVRIFLIKL